MSRLVAFGCSYTFGHGLPDCFIPPKHAGKDPSEFAWPSMLAKFLDKKVVNKSRCGASNIQILWKLLNFDFHEDDLCIVMWTHFVRQEFSRMKYDPEYFHNESYAYNKGSIEAYDEENSIIRNFLTINHGHLFLKDKNIKHYFLLALGPELTYKCPESITTPVLLSDINFRNCRIDEALDTANGYAHPGIKSNLKLATMLYNRIK